MRLYFSWRVCAVGLLFVAVFLRLAWWQWNRHLEKQILIEQLKRRVVEQPLDLTTLIQRAEALPFRLANVKGEFDFSHEVTLRNRVLNGIPGVLVLTPLKLADRDQHLIVNRGFLPLVAATPQKRLSYQSEPSFEGVVLLKQSVGRTFLSTADPAAGPPHAWVDQWLRPDISEMAKQLPYSVLPFYGEIVSENARANLVKQILSSEGGREEILSLELRHIGSDETALDPNTKYPIAQVDTVIPPDIHLGYTFQWCFIALVTALICLIMQRKPRRA